MLSLEGEVLVLDRSQEGDDVLPILRKARKGEWYVDIGMEEGPVLDRLVDAEILDEPFPIRYIAKNGAANEAEVRIEQLISDAEGHRCRLQGLGAPPPALVADSPELR